MSCRFYLARQGYILGRNPSTTTPPDLTQFVETDSACRLYILAGNNPSSGEYTYGEFNSLMEDCFENYNAMTPVQDGHDANDPVFMPLWVPAFNIGNRGYEAAVLTNTVSSSDTRIWIVPALKRVLIGTPPWGYPTRAFKYDPDSNTCSGSLLDIANPLIFAVGGNLRIAFRPYVGTSFDSTALSTSSNWSTRQYQLNTSVTQPNITRTLSYNTGSVNATRLSNLFSDAAEPEEVATDPYDPGGTTTTGGGTGTFSTTSDPVPIPGLPSISAADSGFITLFTPSISQLRDLCSYMWGSVVDWTAFLKVFADPMDCILGLSIVPVAVPHGGTRNVKVGNINTPVSMTVAAQQYIIVDCGTLDVEEFWGAYLDYDPYTRAEIYLPYIGTHAISVDDIMGKSVHVEYHVDILSGACTAFVECGNSVLYSFNGQCASSIPITGKDWTNVVNGALTVAASIGTMVATKGAATSVAAGMSASAGAVVDAAKQNVEKSGSMAGTGGMLAIQTPYLILTRPRLAIPREQNRLLGYPSFITVSLGELSGYTEVDSVRLTAMTATGDEIKEIERLLGEGVIF